MEFSKEGDWARAQEIEEEQVKAMVEKLLELKPDLVITEKGVSGQYLLPWDLNRGKGSLTQKDSPPGRPRPACSCEA